MNPGTNTFDSFSIDRGSNSPRSKSVPDMLTTKQTGMIFALAGKAGVDANKACADLFDCQIHELSKQGASVLISQLQEMPKADRADSAKKQISSSSPQLDLFSLADVAPDKPQTVSNFEPQTKRAAFADPANPLNILAAEIVASCGVQQTATRVYLVNSLSQGGTEEFTVTVFKIGGPKCGCPDFVRKAPLAVGGKFRCEHIIAAHMFYREIAAAVKG